MDLSDFTDSEDEQDRSPKPDPEPEWNEVNRPDRDDDRETSVKVAVERYCENRPRCPYEVSSMTPNAGSGFPTRCFECGGELIKPEDYDGPEP